jgi:hypothetical protein
MFKLILSCLLLTAFSSVQASYVISSYKTSKIDFSKPTRVMIAGDGDALGLLFLEVAKARALRYYENNNSDQIVLISTNDKELGAEQALTKWGFKIEETDSSSFDGKVFIDEVSKYKKILSIDIFSHSSAQFGIHLDGKANRISVKTKDLNLLKPNFTKDAFVYLHGCNSGFNLAPFLSEIWGIPVAGSLTSTNFQKLHSDGNFYLTEEGYSPNSDWAKENTLSNNQTLSCPQGVCQRLKPDNTGYYGWWGQYKEGGLPFYKFFCVKNNPEDCKRVMAQSLLSHTLIVNLKKTSSLEVYKQAVIDFLCPVSSKTNLRGECQAELENALLTKDLTYNPFTRPQVECDFKGCKAEIVCEKILFTGLPKPGTCSLKNNISSPSTTIVREFIAYMDGYKSLAQ